MFLDLNRLVRYLQSTWAYLAIGNIFNHPNLDFPGTRLSDSTF